jgi:hypothetical protein
MMEDDVLKELKKQMMVVYEVLKDPELIETIADFSSKLFMKLKEKGFTEDQAMMIVSAFSKSKQ